MFKQSWSRLCSLGPVQNGHVHPDSVPQVDVVPVVRLADGDPKERHRFGVEQILQRDARLTAESFENGLWHPGSQLRLHFQGVHSD